MNTESLSLSSTSSLDSNSHRCRKGFFQRFCLSIRDNATSTVFQAFSILDDRRFHNRGDRRGKRTSKINSSPKITNIFRRNIFGKKQTLSTVKNPTQLRSSKKVAFEKKENLANDTAKISETLLSLNDDDNHETDVFKINQSEMNEDSVRGLRKQETNIATNIKDNRPISVEEESGTPTEITTSLSKKSDHSIQKYIDIVLPNRVVSSEDYMSRHMEDTLEKVRDEDANDSEKLWRSLKNHDVNINRSTGFSPIETHDSIVKIKGNTEHRLEELETGILSDIKTKALTAISSISDKVNQQENRVDNKQKEAKVMTTTLERLTHGIFRNLDDVKRQIAVKSKNTEEKCRVNCKLIRKERYMRAMVGKAESSEHSVDQTSEGLNKVENTSACASSNFKLLQESPKCLNDQIADESISVNKDGKSRAEFLCQNVSEFVHGTPLCLDMPDKQLNEDGPEPGTCETKYLSNEEKTNQSTKLYDKQIEKQEVGATSTGKVESIPDIPVQQYACPKKLYSLLPETTDDLKESVEQTTSPERLPTEEENPSGNSHKYTSSPSENFKTSEKQESDNANIGIYKHETENLYYNSVACTSDVTDWVEKEMDDKYSTIVDIGNNKNIFNSKRFLEIVLKMNKGNQMRTIEKNNEETRDIQAPMADVTRARSSTADNNIDEYLKNRPIIPADVFKETMDLLTDLSIRTAMNTTFADETTQCSTAASVSNSGKLNTAKFENSRLSEEVETLANSRTVGDDVAYMQSPDSHIELERAGITTIKRNIENDDKDITVTVSE